MLAFAEEEDAALDSPGSSDGEGNEHHRSHAANSATGSNKPEDHSKMHLDVKHSTTESKSSASVTASSAAANSARALIRSDSKRRDPKPQPQSQHDKAKQDKKQQDKAKQFRELRRSTLRRAAPATDAQGKPAMSPLRRAMQGVDDDAPSPAIGTTVKSSSTALAERDQRLRKLEAESGLEPGTLLATPRQPTSAGAAPGTSSSTSSSAVGPIITTSTRRGSITLRKPSTDPQSSDQKTASLEPAASSAAEQEEEEVADVAAPTLTVLLPPGHFVPVFTRLVVAAARPYIATLTVLSETRFVSIPVRAEGGSVALHATPNEVDFGAVGCYHRYRRTVTLRNAGSVSTTARLYWSVTPSSYPGFLRWKHHHHQQQQKAAASASTKPATAITITADDMGSAAGVSLSATTTAAATAASETEGSWAENLAVAGYARDSAYRDRLQHTRQREQQQQQLQQQKQSSAARSLRSDSERQSRKLLRLEAGRLKLEKRSLLRLYGDESDDMQKQQDKQSGDVAVNVARIQWQRAARHVRHLIRSYKALYPARFEQLLSWDKQQQQQLESAAGTDGSHQLVRPTRPPWATTPSAAAARAAITPAAAAQPQPSPRYGHCWIDRGASLNDVCVCVCLAANGIERRAPRIS